MSKIFQFLFFKKYGGIKIRIRNSKWAKENPQKRAAKEARRRALKLKATLPNTDFEEIALFYLNCPDNHHVDHIIPIQGETVTGLHVLWNLQYLPSLENISKKNTFDGTYSNEGWRVR